MARIYNITIALVAILFINEIVTKPLDIMLFKAAERSAVNFSQKIKASIKVVNTRWGCGKKCLGQQKIFNILAESRNLKLKKNKKMKKKAKKQAEGDKRNSKYFQKLFLNGSSTKAGRKLT